MVDFTEHMHAQTDKTNVSKAQGNTYQQHIANSIWERKWLEFCSEILRLNDDGWVFLGGGWRKLGVTHLI